MTERLTTLFFELLQVSVGRISFHQIHPKKNGQVSFLCRGGRQSRL